MGLILLGAFWFAGAAIAAALARAMMPRGGILAALVFAAAALAALQALYLAGGSACPAGGCGGLPELLDRIRITLAVLTVAGVGAGLWLGGRAPRAAAAAIAADSPGG